MPDGYTTFRKIPQFPLNFTQGVFGGIVAASGGGTTNFLRADGAWVAPPGTVVGANPTASVGLSAVNGSAATFMTSDSAPPLSQSIVPTWTGAHTFTGSIPQVTLGSSSTSNSGELQLNGSTSGNSLISVNSTGNLTILSASTLTLNTGCIVDSSGNLTANTLALTTGQYANWTPTFSASTGTLGTTTLNSARFQQIGKQVHFYIDLQITSAGTTPSGMLIFTLPVTPKNQTMAGEVSGWEFVNSTALGGFILGNGPNGRAGATSVNIMLNGNHLLIGGMYEAN